MDERTRILDGSKGGREDCDLGWQLNWLWTTTILESNKGGLIGDWHLSH